MAYKYRIHFSKHSVLKKYKRLIFILTLFLLLAIAGCIVVVYYISSGEENYQPQTSLVSKSFHPLQKFETPYFYFEADKSWRFMEQESTSNIFVYRSATNNVVKRDLTVYVNTLPQNLLLTRVLPVDTNGDRFDTGEVSGHCKDYLKSKIQPGNNNPIEGVVETVNIKCQIDGTSTTIGTGQKNGGYQAELTGSTGKPQKYYLLYHDLEFNPKPTEFLNIVRNFRAK